MDTSIPQDELNEQIRARFKELPKVVQDAITSADVQKQLRELADVNKLHLDQWQVLENEVMLTLLGFQKPEDLSANLKADLDLPEPVARELAENISKIVFAPIRTELERELSTTQTQTEQGNVSAPVNSAAPTAVTTTTPVAPATPPAPGPPGQAVRAPISDAYKSGETSAARKAVDDDPYREPAV